MIIRRLAISIVFLSVSVGCGSGLPSETDAKEDLETLLNRGSTVVSITSFTKVDGLRSRHNEIDTYEIQFSADVSVESDPPQMDQVLGKLTYIRTESGWQASDFHAESRNERKRGEEINSAKRVLYEISQALLQYKIDNYEFPSEAQGLNALIEMPVGEPLPINWREGGYLESLSNDPWGNEYIYKPTNHGFEVISLGADGALGGSGANRDIVERYQ